MADGAWSARRRFAGCGLLCAAVLAASAARCGQPACDREALQLGQQVLAVRRALEEPPSEDALAAIVELGTDSRYYTLVRGWLGYELEGLKSVLGAAEPEARPDIALRAVFIKRAIRAIDLE